jgi:hypothetical protein
MEQPTPHLNVSELYRRRVAKDAARLRTYNQILDSIHHRIRTSSQMPMSPCEVLYTIPPFILGLPKIDLEDCVVYLVHQLRTEGFEVRYTYPNLLLISWMHHEKSYILDQSPIMQAMLENSEAAAAAERSRFGRKGFGGGGGGGSRKPRSLAGTGVPPPSFAPATNLRPPPAVSFAPPSVGRAPAAGDYVPPSSFLHTMERPRPRPGPEPAPVLVPTSVGGGGGAGAGAGGTSGGALDPIGGVLMDLWKT